ncbi:hypothetical protein DPMN_055592 [Dreissena polymorpha]|uniref:GH10 domain-containing protein n=1 Tax=Dreissena polymorpha TaxID=45954 RepID=A0A9D4CR21_DREPO|nr:hypothetical protein DPMN_055592 [Dreissena polymorpha]
MLEPVLAFAVLLVNHALGAELFLNPGMEQPDMVGTWGNAWGYKVDRINTDSHSGNYSAKLYQRTQSYQGIGQDVALTTNTRYAIEGYVKLLNNNSKMSQEFEFMIRYQWSNDFSNSSWIQIGFHRFAHPKDGWIRVAADFTTPLRQWHLANVYIQGPDVGIDYLADDFSLKEVPENTTWRQASLDSIERIRKSNITLSVNVGAQYDPHFIEVEVALRSHEFGFGSVIDDAAYLDLGYVTYQNLLHEFFNWATVGTYKWGYNQGTPTHPNYDRAVNATNALLKNGMIVRGHNMFWGTTGDTPDWAQKLSSDQLKATIDERIRFMTNITYGKLAHWDVNNEMLHGQVYEEITRDPNYSQHIYRAVHAADPSVKLFLNEYNVLANGDSTEDFVRQALSFKAANCGLYGLGLQSHFADYVAPDPILILRRLKRLASTGLPLWITELSLANKNENVTADWFEQVLTIYFAHPAVEGVILWGFWDRMGVNSD